MGKGRFATWPDEHLRTYGDELSRSAEAAAQRAGGWHEQTISVGGRAVVVRCTSAAVHRLVARATHHLRTSAPPTLRISVCDTASSGVSPPDAPPWSLDHWRHEGRSTVLYTDRDRDSIAWTDAARGEAVWWLPDERAIPSWERPAPLRILLDRLLGPTGSTLVHAGVVGDDRDGILIAGRSGSGKSTTVTTCVAAGMHTGGDDFVVVHDHDPTVVWSLYATARLGPESPAWSTFTADPSAIEPPSAHHVGEDNATKTTVYVDEQFAGRVRTRFTVRAVVVPVIGSGRRSVLSPLRRSAAVLALAPSSMFHVDPRRSALTTIGAVATAPCYSLQLGSDLDHVHATIASILDT